MPAMKMNQLRNVLHHMSRNLAFCVTLYFETMKSEKKFVNLKRAPEPLAWKKIRHIVVKKLGFNVQSAPKIQVSAKHVAS